MVWVAAILIDQTSHSFKRQKFGRIITYQLWWLMELLQEAAVEGVYAALETRPSQGHLLQIQLQCMKINFRMAFFTKVLISGQYNEWY
jgi:hypothetical protein